jgi:hypothetical protein
MRPPLRGGLIISGIGSGSAIVFLVRPATAIILVILLVIIAVAGIIQLVSILAPPG